MSLRGPLQQKRSSAVLNDDRQRSFLEKGSRGVTGHRRRALSVVGIFTSCSNGQRGSVPWSHQMTQSHMSRSQTFRSRTNPLSLYEVGAFCVRQLDQQAFLKQANKYQVGHYYDAREEGLHHPQGSWAMPIMFLVTGHIAREGIIRIQAQVAGRSSPVVQIMLQQWVAIWRLVRERYGKTVDSVRSLCPQE